MRRIWMALVLLGCTACSTSGSKDSFFDHEVTGDVLLESYSVDLTWGYKMSGMYIDSNATVWAYEHTGTPWYPEHIESGELSERDMLTKHKGARQIGTVDPQLLHDMAKMIKPAGRGKITHAANTGAGSGSLEVAYLLDPDHSTYREIILAGQGDRVATNSAPEAKILLDYLRDVQTLVAAPNQ